MARTKHYRAGAHLTATDGRAIAPGEIVEGDELDGDVAGMVDVGILEPVTAAEAKAEADDDADADASDAS